MKDRAATRYYWRDNARTPGKWGPASGHQLTLATARSTTLSRAKSRVETVTMPPPSAQHLVTARCASHADADSGRSTPQATTSAHYQSLKRGNGLTLLSAPTSKSATIPPPATQTSNHAGIAASTPTANQTGTVKQPTQAAQPDAG